MIELYTSPTPNGWKVSIALEELALPYTVHSIALQQLEQKEDWYLKLNPNGRIPTIVDKDAGDFAVFESGAILLYLGEKSGRFLPADVRGRYDVTQWVMWQMGGLGPMGGQVGHFRLYAPEPIEYAVNRYTDEVNRLYGVLDRRLTGRQYICGDVSIADFACWPWIVPHQRHGQEIAKFANLHAWYERMKQRPGLRRGFDVGAEIRRASAAGPDAEARKILFGQRAETKSTVNTDDHR